LFKSQTSSAYKFLVTLRAQWQLFRVSETAAAMYHQWAALVRATALCTQAVFSRMTLVGRACVRRVTCRPSGLRYTLDFHFSTVRDYAPCRQRSQLRITRKKNAVVRFTHKNILHINKKLSVAFRSTKLS
jgi:hypothetical protein